MASDSDGGARPNFVDHSSKQHRLLLHSRQTHHFTALPQGFCTRPVHEPSSCVQQSGEAGSPPRAPPRKPRVDQLYFGDLAERWVRIKSALTSPFDLTQRTAVRAQRGC